MPEGDTPGDAGGESGSGECLGPLGKLSPEERDFCTSLVKKGCPESLRTLLVWLRRMENQGGYTQQEPAKRFAPPYRDPTTKCPVYHKVRPDGSFELIRARVNEHMTGGRLGMITVPPEQLVKYCVQVYVEHTNAATDEPRLMAKLLEWRKTASRDVTEMKPKAADSAQEVRDLTAQVNNLLAERKRAQDDKTALQDLVTKLTTALATMTSTGQQQTQQISDLHVELNQARAQLTERDNQITTLTAEITTRIAEGDRWHQQAGRLQSQNDRLHARLAERDTQTTDEETFREIVARSGLHNPLEHAMVGGDDVRRATDTDITSGQADPREQRPGEERLAQPPYGTLWIPPYKAYQPKETISVENVTRKLSIKRLRVFQALGVIVGRVAKTIRWLALSALIMTAFMLFVMLLAWLNTTPVEPTSWGGAPHQEVKNNGTLDVVTWRPTKIDGFTTFGSGRSSEDSNDTLTGAAGTLNLNQDHGNCATAKVGWSLLVQPSGRMIAHGTLTATSQSTDLSKYEFPDGGARIALSFQRLDDSLCSVSLQWKNPRIYESYRDPSAGIG